MSVSQLVHNGKLRLCSQSLTPVNDSELDLTLFQGPKTWSFVGWGPGYSAKNKRLVFTSTLPT